MTPLRAASAALRAGGLVAFPTDTVYGIGALLGDAAAVRRLYALKGRAPGKPVAICVPTADDIGCYARTCFGSGARALASGAALAALLPGPVTVVLERLPGLPAHLNTGHRLVGVRVPDHPLAVALAQQCGGALALSSANESGATGAAGAPGSPQAFRALWPGLGAVLGEDGALLHPAAGAAAAAAAAAAPSPADGARPPQPPLPSTVVDLSVPGRYRVLRNGAQLQQTVATLDALGCMAMS
jgi:tRNA threonylcarbamoyl adenosine modification protein (Sua5/YciO/YrdC/YwlC family)